MKNLINLILLFLIGWIPLGIAQIDQSFLIDNNFDLTQDTISRNLFTVTNKIDGFFGKEKLLEEKNGSKIRVEYGTTIQENAMQTTAPDLDVKVRLKQLENKLNFKFNSEKIGNDETLQNQEVSDTSKKNSTLDDSIFRASIGFFKEQEKYWSIYLDTGIKIESSLNPFAKAGGRRSFYFGETELRISNKTYVENTDGMFNYTDINLNRKLNRDFSFTYANKFVWKNELNEFTTVHGPSFYQVLNDKESISYNFRTRFHNRPTFAITGHEIFSSYRRNLYKKWIFLNLTPGISFLTENNYTRSAFFTAKLQALFGDY